MDDVDREIIEALAAEGMGAFTDAVYTPQGGGDPVTGVYVIVEDLEDDLGDVTQGGAVLRILRSQVGTPVQGATLAVDGTTWNIGRRRPTTDPSMVAVEAYK